METAVTTAAGDRWNRYDALTAENARLRAALTTIRDGIDADLSAATINRYVTTMRNAANTARAALEAK